MPKKPNLIYIFADQMRAMDMHCAGNNTIFTPNMDKLYTDGAHFETCVSCFPVCTPYRACLISGKYPTSTDVLDNDIPLPLTHEGFGYTLKNSGYQTGWIGKWHLFGSEAVRTTFIPPGEHRHGFDDCWIGVNCTHQYYDGFYYKNDDPQPIQYKGYEPDIQTDFALDYIQTNQNNSFALFLSFGPPHDPYHDVPEKWKALYDKNDISFRENVNENEPFFDRCLPGNFPNPNFDIGSIYSQYSQDKNIRKLPNKEVIRDYYAAITALDWNIGRIVDKLQDLGLNENTVLVFTSDHGDMLYSQGTIQKNHPWNESILVPFLIKYPQKIKAGIKCTAPYNTVDIMPTILELMDIQTPDFCEGNSFADFLSGSHQKLPDCAYIMCSWDWMIPEWRGIRTERYTYVVTKDGSIMLYDNHKDPFQLHNFINDDAYQTVRVELNQKYQRLQDKIHDPFEQWSSIKQRMQKKRQKWEETYHELL